MEVTELVTVARLGAGRGKITKGRSAVGPPFLLRCLAGWKCVMLEETAGRGVWGAQESGRPWRWWLRVMRWEGSRGEDEGPRQVPVGRTAEGTGPAYEDSPIPTPHPRLLSNPANQYSASQKLSAYL